MTKNTLTAPTKMRLALLCSSTSCLTYNALRIAYGLCGDWGRIAIVDSTGHTFRYAHLGMFTTIGISTHYGPERYYEAMELCEQAGMEVIILNTLTPEYNGNGGILDRLNEGHMEEALRAHRALSLHIRESEAHVIGTIVTKARLTIKGRSRLHIAQQPLQQPGFEKSFQTVLHLDRSNWGTTVKDDTGLLPQKQPFPIDATIGAQLKRWCDSNMKGLPDDLQWKLNGCHTMYDLYQLLFQFDTDDPAVLAAFTRRRLQLEGSREQAEELIDLPF